MPKTWKSIFPATRLSAAVAAGGVKGDLVKAGEFDKIRELTAEVRKLVDSIRR